LATRAASRASDTASAAIDTVTKSIEENNSAVRVELAAESLGVKMVARGDSTDGPRE
jgi:hypothetical protein